MTLKSIFLFLLFIRFIHCSDLVQEILGDNNTSTDSTVAITSTEIVPTITTPTIACDFGTYDCPKILSEAIANAINTAIASGNLPILVCDIDETLIKRTAGYSTATDLYHNLKSSGALFKTHGLLALTARIVNVENVMPFTQAELNLCTPEFVTCLKNPANLGSILGRLDFSSEKRFLHDYGLVIMGQGGLTKRQALDVFLNQALNDNNKKYELLFVDNDIGWFSEFCNGIGYDPKIVKGNFFHYRWEVGEKVQVTPPSPTVDQERIQEMGDIGALRDSIKSQLEAPKVKKHTPVAVVAGRFTITDVNYEDDFDEWDFS